MIKKRSRPQPRIRERSIDPEDEPTAENEEEEKLPLAELIELRKLRKARQGIDATKLTKGDVKKRRRPVEEPEQKSGLHKGATPEHDDDGAGEAAEKEARARRVVRQNNFTQQTNALDVDKHMCVNSFVSSVATHAYQLASTLKISSTNRMAYIEENLKVRGRPRDDDDDATKPADSDDDLYKIVDRWKVDKQNPPTDEGSVTNSLTMLTAIPEVDLGMDARLKNIEETEKAKRVVAEERQDRKRSNNDEGHLVASRFYRPDLRQKSDADIMRDAKLEAMGVAPRDDSQRRQDRPQMATDEMVMERFKKRMRK
ncbi:hypothetical protein HGRIS_010223 [Hohenbuehelia grisea]|uniref:Hepatocellular carcinoma-associated antigen 59-domain-containing protein n=1 Tax=Hohenbuehelia grisea TaxID=104357 RepID=A0ABR3J409_9AGAR